MSEKCSAWLHIHVFRHRKKSTLSIVPGLRYKSLPVWNHCHCIASTLNLCFSNGFTWIFGRPCRDFTGFYLLRLPYRNEPGMGAPGRITPGSAASRARASWMTEVSKEGRTYKDKGEPIGTAPDPLAGTAVDCVISWKSFVLENSCSRHRRLATFSWSGLLLTFLNLDSPSCLQRTSQYYFVLQSLHKRLPVLLRPSKLAQSTSQYYFELQSLHKVLPSTTSYYKACTKYYFVLQTLHKVLAKSSKYYFVLQSWHKILPSSTSYYKACTKHLPVLLRTTKFAQSTSQCYCVLQSLHTILPSSTSYYKPCTK